MLEKASGDSYLNIDSVKDCMRELALVRDTIDDLPFGRFLKSAWKLLRKRPSPLITLYLEMDSLSRTELFQLEPTKNGGEQQQSLAVKTASWMFTKQKGKQLVVIPKVWKARGQALGFSISLFVSIARKHEKRGEHLYPFIQGVLRSVFGVLAGVSTFGHEVEDELLDTLYGTEGERHPDLDQVRDLVVAMHSDLPGYYAERVCSDPPFPAQLDNLVQAVVAWSVYRIKSIWDMDPYIRALTGQGARLRVEEVRHVLLQAKCVNDVASLLSGLKISSGMDLWRLQLQMNPNTCGGVTANELLLHWAQHSCVRHDKLFCDAVVQTLLKSLDTLLAFGAQINKPCYPGGTMLQALLDKSVTPSRGRSRLYQKEKFIALVKRGIDPKIASTVGTALEAAAAYRTQRLEGIKQVWIDTKEESKEEVNFILDWLKAYKSDGAWPAFSEDFPI